MDFRLSKNRKKARFRNLYSERELYEALLKTYTKALFRWRKALTMSYDGGTLYDFARHTTRNAEHLQSGVGNLANLILCQPVSGLVVTSFPSTFRCLHVLS